ncbi:Asp-tRNA(Asn)/Glu-tRNA(Gln) amidotransferase subunit GatC [Salinispira pacifica]
METSELELTADLAHIDLKQEEYEALGRAVEQMIEYFERMNEVDVSGLEPTTHALLLHNRLRPDLPSEEGIADSLLDNAPELEDRFIVIPNVL